MFRMTLISTAAAAVAAALISSPSFAADVKAEITTAAQHATLAAQAGDVAGVHTHLHHTLNCLEGPKGADFTSKEIDPCQNDGSGAIPDSTDPTTVSALQSAVGQALQGLKATDLKTAQSDANAAAATLQAIK